MRDLAKFLSHLFVFIGAAFSFSYSAFAESPLENIATTSGTAGTDSTSTDVISNPSIQDSNEAVSAALNAVDATHFQQILTGRIPSQIISMVNRGDIRSLLQLNKLSQSGILNSNREFYDPSWTTIRGESSMNAFLRSEKAPFFDRKHVQIFLNQMRYEGRELEQKWFPSETDSDSPNIPQLLSLAFSKIAHLEFNMEKDIEFRDINFIPTPFQNLIRKSTELRSVSVGKDILIDADLFETLRNVVFLEKVNFEGEFCRGYLPMLIQLINEHPHLKYVSGIRLKPNQFEKFNLDISSKDHKIPEEFKFEPLSQSEFIFSLDPSGISLEGIKIGNLKIADLSRVTAFLLTHTKLKKIQLGSYSFVEDQIQMNGDMPIENKFDDEKAIAFIKAFENHPSLKELGFDHPQLSVRSTQVLFNDLIYAGPKLRKVRLFSTQVSPALITEMAPFLASTTTFREMNIFGYAMHKDQATEYFEKSYPTVIESLQKRAQWDKNMNYPIHLSLPYVPRYFQEKRRLGRLFPVESQIKLEFNQLSELTMVHSSANSVE